MEVPKQVRKYGYDFELLQSDVLEVKEDGKERHKAIYVAKDTPLLNIEVVILTESEPHPLYGGTDKTLSYPLSERWGKSGWTVRSQDKALEKYNNL